MKATMPKQLHYPELATRVRSQGELQPFLYGNVDFDAQPYRLATAPEDDASLPAWVADRAATLGDPRVVELISTTTMLGDVLADPYASLMAERPFKSLIEMLTLACREGIDAVADAPPELRAFIEAMETKPGWLDMELVEEGAREARIPAAFLAPFVTRGVFVATFMNTYAALPMALTGQLGGRKAARRVNETSSFFAVTTLPGALGRSGPGFEAAAKVRLMHSMVRYNALKRSDRWDLDIYGIPVPQIDQVPAGLINIYLLAARARRQGRSEFNHVERALVEFGRYRCFLLGLPEELLPTTVEGTLRVMHARAALLRRGFDETCAALVRGTMDAYLRAGETPADRAAEAIEKSYSKAFFLRAFVGGEKGRETAKDVGVSLGAGDKLRIAVTAPFVIGRFMTVQAANRVPLLRDLADHYTIRMIKRRLATYGNPEFTTDSTTYRSATTETA